MFLSRKTRPMGIATLGKVAKPTLVANAKSIDFDGTNDDIILPASNLLITGNNVTFACWAKTTDTDRTYLMANQKGAGSTNLSLSINADETTETAGVISAVMWPGSVQHTYVVYDGNVNDSQWHHYAFTTTSSAQVLYLDGVAVATGTNTFSNSASSNSMTIGSLNNTNYHLQGNMDEVAIWSRVLKASEIADIYNSKRMDLSQSSLSYSASNLVAWYRMGDGDTYPYIADRRKTFFTGKSMDFDGSNDYIEVGDAQLMTTAGTVSAWIFVKSGTTVQAIVNKYNAGTGNREFRLTIESDEKPQWNVQSAIGSFDSNTLAKSGTALSEDTWNHIVGTFSANNAPKLYVNGSLVATASSNIDADGIDNGNSSIFFGRGINNTSVTEIVNAGTKITDVAIWNAELSAADISDIYNSGEPTDLTLAASYDTDRTSNLKGYWRMGNGTLDGNDGSDSSTWLIADQTDATLGSELIIANPYVAASWSTYGTNVESFVSGESVTITYGNSSSGSLATFNNSTNNILESNIVAGKKYKFSFTLATDDTDVNPILLGADEGNIYAGTGAGDKIIYFTGKSSGSPTFRVISLSAGKYYTLSNLSLKQVGGNPGTSVNMATDDVVELAPNRLTGTMTNMASGDLETDVPT